MADLRPEPEDYERDTGSRPEKGEPDGEDSIEILEVVGMEAPTEAAPGREAGETAPSQDDSESSIPYSRQELWDRLRRTQAEFENARKRQARDQDESKVRIWMDLLGRLLPFLDNLDRALEGSSETPSPLREGVALSLQQMKEKFRREGLEEIEAVGKRFDPHLHEAVETQVVEGLEEGIVLQDLRRGYRFRGHLLRPTLVRVSAPGGRPAEKKA